ncbi:hypothetical protein PDK35_02515 [Bacillus cereus group sp. TH153LC]|uniref:hypothetical protein n=1 Tax=Bacillus cereus group sp. TH153LC TaxID=3018059 RepID=UPI0022E0BF2D|nr:hypothetical protein [Bacillus cereus group sp. TH153LC]MDA1658849.1 hypothetical protein [Bacillus cereus group sp. TH153LC]
MAKTYKTERGLKTALKKVLGVESKATEKGIMSDGFLMFPVENNATYRVIIIKDGYPSSLNSMQLETLEEDFGAQRFVDTLFEKECLFVDIHLEVSK